MTTTVAACGGVSLVSINADDGSDAGSSGEPNPAPTAGGQQGGRTPSCGPTPPTPPNCDGPGKKIYPVTGIHGCVYYTCLQSKCVLEKGECLRSNETCTGEIAKSIGTNGDPCHVEEEPAQAYRCCLPTVVLDAGASDAEPDAR